MRSCELAIGENGRATLLADNGNVRVSRELTPAEMSRLSAALNDGTLSEEARRMRVAGLLNSVGLAQLRAGHGRTAGTDGEPEKIAVP